MLIDTRKDSQPGSLILEIWDKSYQQVQIKTVKLMIVFLPQTRDFACLDKLEEEDGLVAVLCHTNERIRLLMTMLMIKAIVP